MSADASAELTPPTSAERGAERRLRFRQSIGQLVSQAQAKDLIRWIIVPGAVAIILGFNFMLFAWIGAARTTREIEQIPYLISGGLVGLAFVIVGGLLLASAFWMIVIRKFQDEAEERSRLHLHALEERLTELVTSAPANNGADARRAARRPRRATRTSGR